MIRFFAIVALATIATLASAEDNPVGIDFATYAQQARERLMRADADHDGKLSKEEYTGIARALGAEHDGSRMFDRMDANHDGLLDANELTNLLIRRFARLDANHDGVLTAEERKAMRGNAADAVQ